MSNRNPQRPPPSVPHAGSSNESPRLIACTVTSHHRLVPDDVSRLLAPFGTIEHVRSPPGQNVFWVTFEHHKSAKKLYDRRDVSVHTKRGETVKFHFEWSHRPQGVPVTPTTANPSPYDSTTSATFPEPAPGFGSVVSGAGSGQHHAERSAVPISHKQSSVPGRPTTSTVPQSPRVPSTNLQQVSSHVPTGPPTNSNPPVSSSVSHRPPDSRKRTYSNALNPPQHEHVRGLSQPPTPPQSPGRRSIGLPSPTPFERDLPPSPSESKTPNNARTKKRRVSTDFEKDSGMDAKDAALEEAALRLERSEQKRQLLQDEADKLADEALESSHRIAVLEKEGIVSSREKEELKAVLEDKDSQLRTLQRAFEQLKVSSNQTQALYEQREADSRTRQNQVETLTNQLTSIHDQLDGIRLDLQTEREVSATRLAATLDAESQRNTAEHEVDRLRDMQLQLEMDLKTERERFQAISEEREIAAGIIAELESETVDKKVYITELEDKCSGSDADLKKAQTALAESTSQLNFLGGQYEEVLLDCERLRNASTEAENSHAAQTGDVTRLYEGTLEELKTFKEISKQVAEELREQLVVQEFESTSLLNHLTQARRNAQRMEEQVAAFLREIVSLTPNLSTAMYLDQPGPSRSSGPQLDSVIATTRDLLGMLNSADAKRIELEAKIAESSTKAHWIEHQQRELELQLARERENVRSRDVELEAKSRSLAEMQSKGRSLEHLTKVHEAMKTQTSTALQRLRKELEEEKEARLDLEAKVQLPTPRKTNDAEIQTSPEPEETDHSIPQHPFTAGATRTSSLSQTKLPVLFDAIVSQLKQSNKPAQQPGKPTRRG